MQVEIAHFASAKWFAAVWEQAVDELLERSFQFEMTCALQLEDEIKRNELRHDANLVQ